MLVNINAASSGKQNALGELGELSRARVNLSEFRYNRSVEIYGESEPADYIYQVIDGAVRSYKLLSDGRRQIGAFHLADSFGTARAARKTSHITGQPAAFGHKKTAPWGGLQKSDSQFKPAWL